MAKSIYRFFVIILFVFLVASCSSGSVDGDTSAMDDTPLNYTPPVDEPPLNYTPPMDEPPLNYTPPMDEPPLNYTPPMDEPPLNYTPPVNDPPLNYTPLNYNIQSYPSPYPYFQAIDFSRNLVSENDPSAFNALTYEGKYEILMPDSRNGADNSVSAFHFVAAYENKSINIHVNSEFGDQLAAEQEAEYYANVIGRIPLFLRDGINLGDGINAVYLHKGVEPLAGTDHSLIIYSQLAETLRDLGILEEVIIHESVHVSLDTLLAGDSDWSSAQIGDGIPISRLAADLGNEDAAETMLAYIAARYRANRLPASVEQTILGTISKRIDYLDVRGLSMEPIVQDQEGTWNNDNLLQHSPWFAYYEQWEQLISF